MAHFEKPWNMKNAELRRDVKNILVKRCDQITEEDIEFLKDCAAYLVNVHTDYNLEDKKL